MNPFVNAKILGKSAEEVLNFLKNWNPKMADKIKQAFALGYTADEVMDYLGNGFDTAQDKTPKGERPQYEKALGIMGENKPESVKQARAEREKDVLSDVLDPNRMMAAAGGAGIGMLTGGPAGAIAGGIGGAVGYEDLAKRYQEHVQQGGNLSLNDFLKSAMKGVSAASVASQAPKVLAALQAMEIGRAHV